LYIPRSVLLTKLTFLTFKQLKYVCYEITAVVTCVSISPRTICCQVDSTTSTITATDRLNFSCGGYTVRRVNRRNRFRNLRHSTGATPPPSLIQVRTACGRTRTATQVFGLNWCALIFSNRRTVSGCLPTLVTTVTSAMHSEPSIRLCGFRRNEVQKGLKIEVNALQSVTFDLSSWCD
jgi:hypothetical protein